jgi:hypothetical protein
MSGFPTPTAVSSIWPRGTDPTTNIPPMTRPMLTGGPVDLPSINNPNLPLRTVGNSDNLPPTIPQPMRTPFPSLQQPLGPGNGFIRNNFPIAPALPPLNPYTPHFVCNLLKKTNSFY